MIDNLLNRLDRVRQTGPGRWIASCPTRDDKHPSMTIRLLDDGRILLHDFGGDSTADILAALGLDWSALFPEGATHQKAPARQPFPALDVLRALAFEAMVLQAAAATLSRRNSLSDVDYERIGLAAQRLQEGVRLAGGARNG